MKRKNCDHMTHDTHNSKSTCFGSGYCRKDIGRKARSFISGAHSRRNAALAKSSKVKGKTGNSSVAACDGVEAAGKLLGDGRDP